MLVYQRVPIRNSNSKLTFQWALDHQRIHPVFVGCILDFEGIIFWAPPPPSWFRSAEVEGRSGLELESRAWCVSWQDLLTRSDHRTSYSSDGLRSCGIMLTQGDVVHGCSSGCVQDQWNPIFERKIHGIPWHSMKKSMAFHGIPWHSMPILDVTHRHISTRSSQVGSGVHTLARQLG